ncbi:hypothetical protein EBB07_21005 [Paenibacillaceae bacterium]|nr:hypothetical protein EBB07_21005 [Paenibacillaceae bacterium]
MPMLAFFKLNEVMYSDDMVWKRNRINPHLLKHPWAAVPRDFNLQAVYLLFGKYSIIVLVHK